MRKRQRGIILSLALVCVALVGVDAMRILDANRARPVTFSAALHRFHTAQSKADAKTVSSLIGYSAGNVAAAASTTTTTAGPTAQRSQTPPPRASIATVAVTATTVAAASAPAPFSEPPEGVYAYRTTGGEQLSLPDSARSYPSTTYATLTHQGGCVWQIENDVIQQHTDRRHFCSQPGVLTQLDQSRSVTFFGATESYDYVCSPPAVFARTDDTAGVTRQAVCADSGGDRAVIHLIVVGPEQVVVGSTPVKVLHIHLDCQLSGVATGTATEDQLIETDDGMIISWHRTVDTLTNAAFGANVRYTEHATFDLESLTPQT